MAFPGTFGDVVAFMVRAMQWMGWAGHIVRMGGMRNAEFWSESLNGRYRVEDRCR
jgi:hypothetical protein